MAEIKLSKISTRAPKGMDKDATKAKTEVLIKEISVLQDILIASQKRAVIVVLQGMDASGKDGVTKNVFSRLSPIGITVHSFKRPTDEEMAHDFLWRVHHVVPPKGMITQYNQVLIMSHHGYII